MQSMKTLQLSASDNTNQHQSNLQHSATSYQSPAKFQLVGGAGPAIILQSTHARSKVNFTPSCIKEKKTCKLKIGILAGTSSLAQLTHQLLNADSTCTGCNAEMGQSQIFTDNQQIQSERYKLSKNYPPLDSTMAEFCKSTDFLHVWCVFCKYLALFQITLSS